MLIQTLLLLFCSLGECKTEATGALTAAQGGSKYILAQDLLSVISNQNQHGNGFSTLSFSSPHIMSLFHLLPFLDIFHDCGINESIYLTEENVVDY